ncbi:MAG: pitrilysin family protein [Alphaproteobacteria bacterium]
MMSKRLICGLVLGLFWLAVNPARAVEVERVVSPGGIEAWLVRDHSVPITAIEFSFSGTGGAHDPDGKAGLAEMVSSLIDEGAGDLDSQAFQRKMEDMSIRISFSAGLETFRGSLKTLNRHRDDAADLLRLSLTAPRFDPDAVARIRQQILVGLQQQSTDPDSIARKVWRRAVFADHPYGRPVGGTVESVAGITIDDMKDFVANRFARDNLIIGVVGDITVDALGPMLDSIFGALPATSRPTPLADAAIVSGGETYVVEMDNPQSVVVFGQAGLRRDDPDYYAAYVMNYVLGGGGFASRLYHEVREKRGLAYSVYSYLNPTRHGALISGGVATRNDRVATSLSVIRDEWLRMYEEGPSESELANAKTFLNGSFPLRLSSTSSIARLLVSMQYHKLGQDYIERRAEIIDAVTLDDVRRVAKRLLAPEKLTVVVVGKPQGITPTSAAPEIRS